MSIGFVLLNSRFDSVSQSKANPRHVPILNPSSEISGRFAWKRRIRLHL